MTVFLICSSLLHPVLTSSSIRPHGNGAVSLWCIEAVRAPHPLCFPSFFRDRFCFIAQAGLGFLYSLDWPKIWNPNPPASAAPVLDYKYRPPYSALTLPRQIRENANRSNGMTWHIETCKPGVHGLVTRRLSVEGTQHDIFFIFIPHLKQSQHRLAEWSPYRHTNGQ